MHVVLLQILLDRFCDAVVATALLQLIPRGTSSAHVRSAVAALTSRAAAGS